MDRDAEGQNKSGRLRKVGRDGAQEERSVNEKQSHGKSTHSRGSRAGVERTPLHFVDAEISEQKEDGNV